MRVLAATITGMALMVAGCGDNPIGASATTPAEPTSEQRPFSGRTLAAGEVVKLSNTDGVRFEPVDKGFVHNYETAIRVLEMGTADQLGDGSTGYRAAKGAGLLVVRLLARVNSNESVRDRVTASVAIDGTPRELPQFWSNMQTDKDGPALSYAVAVPEARRSAELVLKYNEVVQRFDLLARRPTGERPAALYRTDEDARPPWQKNLPALNQPLADRAGQFTDKKITATAQVLFSYFSYAGKVPASATDKAWVSVVLDHKATNHAYPTCLVPLTAFKLTGSDGTVYQPARNGSEEPADPGYIGDVRSTAGFEVPASFRTGTLSMAATQVNCQVSTGTYKQTAAQGEGKIEINIPER